MIHETDEIVTTGEIVTIAENIDNEKNHIVDNVMEKSSF